MTPLAVFVRTLMRTSAIFIGVTAVMLHPSLEWRSSGNGTQQSASRADGLGVTAQQSPTEAAIDALVGALQTGAHGGLDLDKIRRAALFLDRLDAGHAAFRVAAEHGHGCAGGGETFGHCAAENAGAADDDGDFTGQIKQVHRLESYRASPPK